MYKYSSCIFRSLNNVFHLGFLGFLLMKSVIFLQNHNGSTVVGLCLHEMI